MPPAPKDRQTLVDTMTMTFICANLLFIALAWDRIADPLPIALGYVLCLAVTIAVIAIGGPGRLPPPRSKAAAFARWFHGLARQAYPLTMFSFFFLTVTLFDNAVFTADLDPYFAAMDRAVFGSVPSAWLMVKFESFMLSELFHGAYVLYYLSIPGLAFWLYFKGSDGLGEYMTVVVLLFYAACLTYIFLPVVGGRSDPATRALAELYRFGPFTRFMAFIYRSTAHNGAAFPSTHVTISLAVALVSRRHAKPLAPLLAVNACLIIVATIYCGYHYVVDIAGALVYVAALYPVAIRMHRRYGLAPR